MLSIVSYDEYSKRFEDRGFASQQNVALWVALQPTLVALGRGEVALAGIIWFETFSLFEVALLGSKLRN